MTSILAHRGPDGAGYFVDRNVGLGHRRLSIIDLAGGSQPVYNEDKSVCVILNGEIYNYRELKKELAAKGHNFYTESDTEVIAHLYEEDPDRFVEKLGGMFAIAVWDGRFRRLTLARDRIGEKPLYYYVDGERIIFASELKSILLDKSVKREISPEALSDYLVYLCVLAPKTIYEGIYKLPAGHVMICTENGVTVKEYWDLPLGEKSRISEKEAAEELESHLYEAVNSCLISDVPLGAFLSGGLDSSSVVSFMSRIKKDPVLTTAIGFTEKSFDESEYAEQIAKHCGTKHHTEMVNADAVDMIEKIAWHFDEPFADPSAIPTYQLAKIMRKYVTVALSGDGGDEIFAGYKRYYLDGLENRMRQYIPGIIRRSLFPCIVKHGFGVPAKGKTFLSNMSVSQERGHYNSIAVYSDKDRMGILNPDVISALKGYHPFSMMEKHYKKAAGQDDLTKILYVDMKTYLPERMLVKVDRMSMANSLEVRAPFLDYKLVEHAASLPSALKLRGKEGKYILKKVMEKYLPQDIIYRNKKGFDVPLDNWFRNGLKEKASALLLGKDSVLNNYFDNKFIKRIWEDHQGNKKNLGLRIWILYMFEIWARAGR